MDPNEKEFILNQVFAGISRFTIDGEPYYTVNPSRMDRCRSYEVFQKALDDCAYEGFFSEEQVKRFLDSSGIFTSEDAKKLERLYKDIEESQYQLYMSRLDGEKSRFLRKTLARLREMIFEFESRKQSFNHVTVTGYANIVKTQFLIHATLMNDEGKKVFEKNFYEEQNYSLLEKAIVGFTECKVSEKKLREIARTNPWRSYWGASKEDVFGLAAADMTGNQRTLLMYSRMYDNANEHPDSPDDEVVNDDDLFDGWMISISREREKDKKKSHIEKSLRGKQKDAEELFVVANTDEDVVTINDMNDTRGKMVRTQRQKTIEKRGIVRDAQLPDRKQQIMMQANQEYISKVRGAS
jgi:hypothetical protein